MSRETRTFQTCSFWRTPAVKASRHKLFMLKNRKTYQFLFFVRSRSVFMLKYRFFKMFFFRQYRLRQTFSHSLSLYSITICASNERECALSQIFFTLQNVNTIWMENNWDGLVRQKITCFLFVLDFISMIEY